MRQKLTKVNCPEVLICAVVLLGIIGLGLTASAQEKFPTRPVELIVPAPPGGGTDVVARLLADVMEPSLGQKLIVINKPGGSGTIGLNAIMQAKNDGYTLGFVWEGPLTTVPQVLKVNYTLDDFSYLTWISKYGLIFCTGSEFPAKTAKEFFEYARKNPGKLTYAGDGVGGGVHFAGERIFQSLKVKLRLVPYGGAGESIKALLGGHVDVFGGPTTPAMPHIQAGTVRAVFVTTKERFEALPAVPGVSDIGCPEAETINFRGIIGSKQIPSDRLAILEKAFRQATQTDKVKEYLVKTLGETPVASTGKQFEELVRREFAARAVAAKDIGLVPK
jgi:tripartite-type tricarboxylate transporter receptor subunit TctC